MVTTPAAPCPRGDPRAPRCPSRERHWVPQGCAGCAPHHPWVLPPDPWSSVPTRGCKCLWRGGVRVGTPRRDPGWQQDGLSLPVPPCPPASRPLPGQHPRVPSAPWRGRSAAGRHSVAVATGCSAPRRDSSDAFGSRSPGRADRGMGIGMGMGASSCPGQTEGAGA